MTDKNRIISALVSASMMISGIGLSAVTHTENSLFDTVDAYAVSVDYPAQLMNIAVKDNSKVLTENGTSDGSSLSVKALGNNLSPSWRFDRVGKDSKGTFFKFCNAESGRLLTPKGYNVSEGSPVIMFGSESAQSQHWYVIPVKSDRLGNALYYKIVNYSDTDLALTQSSSGIILSSYTGADNQLWLLNSDGLQGFAGYCDNDNTGNIKAGDIGGIFGELVEASSFDELKKYAASDEPYTIVVKNNISVTNLKMDSQNHYYCPDGRIYVHDNKTIIGSYGAHTLNNVQFCTSSNSGVGNNVIIKNFDLNHDAKSNGNDSIVVYFGSGENLWVDHVTFTGHSAVNTQGENVPDYDKFLACCYDADYCTVSDSSFGLHEYGLILGYPDDTEDSHKYKNNYPRMSIIGNQFINTLTRAPGLMRYGYFHSLNNFVYNFSMAYTVHSDCKLFAESCYYDGGATKGNVVCDWNSVTYPGSFADYGSKGVNCKRLGIEGLAKVCNWRPDGNYKYVSLDADSAKGYCQKYSACQNSNSNMMYLRYGSSGVPSAGFNTAPDSEMPSVTQTAVTTATTTETTTTTTTTTVPSVNVQNAENGSVLNADWLTEGQIVSELKVNDTYSITANTEKPVNVLGQTRITADGKHEVSSVIALGGGGNAEYRSIKINAENKGTLNIYMGSSNAETPRTVNLTDGNGNIIQTMENVVGNEINCYSFDIPKADTYYLASASSGLNIYYADIEYAVNTKVDGDVNGDGEFSVADVVMLQKWLIGDGELTDSASADVCNDFVLNVIDLIILKNMLLNK